MSEILVPDRVETPVGIVDLDRARANARRVADYAADHGIGWRPHIKTHKSLELARIQLEAGAVGLTVATLHEAEVMAALTDDILVAYPPVGPARLERLLALPTSLDLKVALDAAEVLDALSAAAAERRRVVGVLVELDVGLGRVGVQTSRQVVELARRCAGSDGVDFRGVTFYPGHIRTRADQQRGPIAAVSRLLADTLAELEHAGLPAGIVSGGSTPTLWHSHEFGEVTEIRSGSCIFFDREGLALGVAGEEDVAYTVLATVVSTAVPGRAVIDAGSKALAKEGRGGDGGFGVLVEHPGVTVAALSEEHGVLDVSGASWTPRIGERVRVVPNHVCVSVNLQDALLTPADGGYRRVALEGRGRGPVP